MRTRIAACSVVWILVAAAAAAQPDPDRPSNLLPEPGLEPSTEPPADADLRPILEHRDMQL